MSASRAGRQWPRARPRDAGSVCNCCGVQLTSSTYTVELVSSVTTSMHELCVAALWGCFAACRARAARARARALHVRLLRHT